MANTFENVPLLAVVSSVWGEHKKLLTEIETDQIVSLPKEETLWKAIWDAYEKGTYDTWSEGLLENHLGWILAYWIIDSTLINRGQNGDDHSQDNTHQMETNEAAESTRRKSPLPQSLSSILFGLVKEQSTVKEKNHNRTEFRNEISDLEVEDEAIHNQTKNRIKRTAVSQKDQDSLLISLGGWCLKHESLWTHEWKGGIAIKRLINEVQQKQEGEKKESLERSIGEAMVQWLGKTGWGEEKSIQKACLEETIYQFDKLARKTPLVSQAEWLGWIKEKKLRREEKGLSKKLDQKSKYIQFKPNMNENRVLEESPLETFTIAFYQEQWQPLLLELSQRDQDTWIEFLANHWLESPMERFVWGRYCEQKAESRHVKGMKQPVLLLGSEHWVRTLLAQHDEVIERLGTQVSKAVSILQKHSAQRSDLEAQWMLEHALNIGDIKEQLESCQNTRNIRMASTQLLNRFYQLFFHKNPVEGLTLAVQLKVLIRLDALNVPLGEHEQRLLKESRKIIEDILHIFNLDKPLPGVWRSDWGQVCVLGALLENSKVGGIQEIKLAEVLDEVLGWGRDLYKMSNSALVLLVQRSLQEHADLGLSPPQKEYLTYFMGLWVKWLERKESKKKNPWERWDKYWDWSVLEGLPIIKQLGVINVVRLLPQWTEWLREQSRQRERAFKCSPIARTDEAFLLSMAILLGYAKNEKDFIERMLNQQLKFLGHHEAVRIKILGQLDEALKRVASVPQDHDRESLIKAFELALQSPSVVLDWMDKDVLGELLYRMKITKA